MSLLGYEFLRQSLQLPAFAPKHSTLLKPVTRVEPTDAFLAIPQNVALIPMIPSLMCLSR
jgi:hypothetical protein